jgi:hypothetical protein
LPELPAKEESEAEGKEAAEAPSESDREDASGEQASEAVDTGSESATETEAEADAPESEGEPATEEGKAAEEGKEDAKETPEASADSDAEKEKELDKVIAERKRIEQENQRKLDEYQETLKKGRENVKDLNLRFGDWYFVVDDEVFHKIRLSREDVTKKKDKPKAEGEAASTEDVGESPAPGTAVPGLPEIPGADE